MTQDGLEEKLNLNTSKLRIWEKRKKRGKQRENVREVKKLKCEEKKIKIKRIILTIDSLVDFAL
jgi:hypothetical protein